MGSGYGTCANEIATWNMGWGSSSNRADQSPPSTLRTVGYRVIPASTNMLERFCSSRKRLRPTNRRHIRVFFVCDDCTAMNTGDASLTMLHIALECDGGVHSLPFRS